MAIGQNFEEAILKAVRGLEIGVRDLNLPAFEKEGDEKIRDRVGQCTDQRIFAIYQALKRHLMTVKEIHALTKIDQWFLWKLEKIAGMDCRIKSDNDSKSQQANDGKDDVSCHSRAPTGESHLLYPPSGFKMVDTCAGEFDAETPYFYSTSDAALSYGSQENEAELFLNERGFYVRQ